MSRSTTHESDAAHVDIAADRVAKVYAQAILEAADAAKCTDAVLAELAALARDVLPKVPEARAVFSSPKIPAEQKAALIDKLGKDLVGRGPRVEHDARRDRGGLERGVLVLGREVLLPQLEVRQKVS